MALQFPPSRKLQRSRSQNINTSPVFSFTKKTTKPLQSQQILPKSWVLHRLHSFITAVEEMQGRCSPSMPLNHPPWFPCCSICVSHLHQQATFHCDLWWWLWSLSDNAPGSLLATVSSITFLSTHSSSTLLILVQTVFRDGFETTAGQPNIPAPKARSLSFLLHFPKRISCTKPERNILFWPPMVLLASLRWYISTLLLRYCELNHCLASHILMIYVVLTLSKQSPTAAFWPSTDTKSSH